MAILKKDVEDVNTHWGSLEIEQRSMAIWKEEVELHDGPHA